MIGLSQQQFKPILSMIFEKREKKNVFSFAVTYNEKGVFSWVLIFFKYLVSHIFPIFVFPYFSSKI